jgi:hypothetical protein
MGDLKNPKVIYLKGALFVVMAVLAGALLVVETPTFRTAALVVVVAWASARAYYFMFYVIEKYVDGRFKFAGVTSFVLYVLGRGKTPPRTDGGEPGDRG